MQLVFSFKTKIEDFVFSFLVCPDQGLYSYDINARKQKPTFQVISEV